MRRLSAILFFSLYLTSTTEASQLLKLPVILQHYHEHQQLNGEISFLDFLDMHYMHGSPHDDDYERDMQLPFKKVDHPASALPLTVSPPTEITVIPTPAANPESFVPLNDSQLYCQYQHSIFQPPRA